MAARISSASIARPWLPLAVALLLAALSLPLFLNLPQQLGIGPLEGAGAGEADVTVVVAEPEPSVAPRVVAVATGAIRAQLQSDPRVASVKSASSALQVELADDSPRARIDAIADFENEIDPGPLEIRIGGSETRLQQARAGIGGDLWRIAILALPFALLLLTAISGWRWALASLLGAVVGLAIGLGAVRLLGELFDVSLLAVAVAAPIAFAGSIEIASALGYRAGDLPGGAGHGERLEAAISEGLGDGLAWALLAAAAGAVAIASGFEQASSLGVGALAGAVGALVAGALVAISALAAGAELPSHRFGPAATLAQRLTSERSPSRRSARIALRVAKALLLALLLGGVSLAVYVLRDELTGDFDALVPAGGGGAAVACALTAGLAIVAARTAFALRVAREASALGAAARATAATAAEASLCTAFGASLLLAALGALLQITDLGAAGEYGVILAVIVLADALIGRLANAVLSAG